MCSVLKEMSYGMDIRRSQEKREKTLSLSS